MLELSRLAEDKLQLERVPFLLHEALEDSIQVLWHAADQKNLELVIDVSPSKVDGRWTDPSLGNHIVDSYLRYLRCPYLVMLTGCGKL